MAVLSWVKSRFSGPQSTGPEMVLRRFSPDRDVPISSDGVSAIEGGWRLETDDERTFRLFEIADPGTKRCRVVFRADMRSEQLANCAYLEIWYRFPRQGEFFSTGVHGLLKGSSSWSTYKIDLHIKGPDSPDLLRLNVIFDGPGLVEIRDVRLTVTPTA